MAIKHNWTILCENMILSVDNELSLINITMNIGVTNIPGVIPRLFIVTCMSGDAGDDYKIELVRPDGGGTFLLSDGKLDEYETAFDVEFRVPNSIVFGEFIPWKLENLGIYKVVLSQGDRIVHEHVFGVYLVEGNDADEPRTQGDTQ